MLCFARTRQVQPNFFEFPSVLFFERFTALGRRAAAQTLPGARDSSAAIDFPANQVFRGKALSLFSSWCWIERVQLCGNCIRKTFYGLVER
jgi:hypothetical protein